MSLRINLNSAALSATRYLSGNDRALGKSIEKLSSGYRVNNAADDPAGLVISQKLRAQIGGLGQAITNSNDATNMIKTAEGALNETHALLLSMRDLAVHASNSGANDSAAIAADQLQIDSAIDQLNRISTNTQFGNKNLLDGTAGIKTTNLDAIHIASAAMKGSVPAGNADVEITVAATQVTRTGTKTFADVDATLVGAGTFTLNDVTITSTAADTATTLVGKINAVANQTNVTASIGADGTGIVFTQRGYGSDNRIDLVDTDSLVNGGVTIGVAGVDAQATIHWADATTEAFTAGKGLQLVGATTGSIINLTTAGNTATTHSDSVLVASGSLVFQVGAYAGQTVDMTLDSVAAADLGMTATGLTTSATSVADIDVTTDQGAQDAIRLIDAAITEVSTTRADLGAFQKNVLESNVNSLSVAKENIAASESSIRDTDMAAEMVNFTRNQILQQAGVSMLAQANMAPQALLKLLG